MKRVLTLATACVLSAMLAACAATDTQRSAGETVDDGAVTAKVKAALIDNETTKARDINVQTYRGVVQLGGFVESEQEKAEAEKVARTIEGVSDVENALEVRPQVASRSAGQYVDDGVVTARVSAALTTDSATKARDINVQTRGGVVQLTGFVDSEDEKDKAEELAKQVSGVQSVRNDIEVKPQQQQ